MRRFHTTVAPVLAIAFVAACDPAVAPNGMPLKPELSLPADIGNAGATWHQLFPTGGPPEPRYSLDRAYDVANDRLMFFSGQHAGGLPRLTDVWVLVNATGRAGPPQWVELHPSGVPPLGREASTTVYDPVSNRLIIHGGCSANCSPALRDTWVLTNANGLGGSPQWIPLPDAPIARAGHAAVYDPTANRMIVFGGHLAFFGTALNDVWVLTDANGLGSPAWVPLSPSGTPPTPRDAMQVAYDPGTNRLILFGGANSPSSSVSSWVRFNDTWVLTNANGLGAPQWMQLSPGGSLPSPRVAHGFVFDPGSNQALLFGGVNDLTDPITYFNDVWALVGANGMGAPPQWIQLAPTGAPPDARGSFALGLDDVRGRMVVALGRRDDEAGSHLYNDVWMLDFVTQVFIDIRPGVAPNPINLTSEGTVPVAVFSSPTFDATTIIPETATLAGAGVRIKRNGNPQAAVEDVNGDGLLDLVLHMVTSELLLALTDTEAVLEGQTTAGVHFRGFDSVVVVP